MMNSDFIERVRELAPEGVNHIVEVAFGANIEADAELLALDGSIASYATDNTAPPIPYWPLAFKNGRLFLLGSDDFSQEAKTAAAHAINDALQAGWAGFEIAERLPLEDIAAAHEMIEHPAKRGRVILIIGS